MLLIVLIACALTADDDHKPAKNDPQEAHQQSLLLLSRVKESRDLLKSGSYRASGRLVKKDDLGETLEGKVELSSAFDFEKGLLRFDRTEPYVLHFGDEGIRSELMTKVVRAPEFTVTWMNSWRHGNNAMVTAVGIHRADDKSIGVSWPFFRPIDVRSLGLDLWKQGFKEGAPFQEAYGAWAASRSIEVSPEDDRTYRLRLKQGRSGTYIPQTLWIDEKQGFSPVHLSYIVPGGNPEQPLMDCKVSWKQLSGAWVPATYHLESRDRGLLIQLDLTFEWLSVNAAVKPDQFTAEGLDVPEGTRIVDYRQNKPVQVGMSNRIIKNTFVYGGIGIAFDPGGKNRVTEIFPNGPAEKDGRLKIGDAIVGVEKESGEVIEFKDQSSVVELITGAPGTKVRIIVIKNGMDKREVYELTRQVIEVPDLREPPPPETRH